MTFWKHITGPLLAVLLMSMLATASSAQNQPASPSPKPTIAAKPDLNKALNVTDLKISMAESSLKLNPTLRSLAELSSALELYLTSHCFGDIFSTLKYDGPPTDPLCIARMERLLEIYPNNPVAVCLRDGMATQSCSDSYRNQTLRRFSGGSSIDEVPDPALKVGLSAAENSKLKALSETLRNVNKDYQEATDDGDKQKHMDDATQLYDQILSTTCRIVALSLEETAAAKKEAEEDYTIREVRTKLLKVPPSLRADYQRQMLLDAESELARSRNDPVHQKIIVEKIKVINNPEQQSSLSTTGKIRVRVVLPSCFDYIEQCSKILPHFPSPICHREGWYSPQCLQALAKWRVYRQEVAQAEAKRSGKQVQPTPNPIISSF
jgi:hypothetical protein